MGWIEIFVHTIYKCYWAGYNNEAEDRGKIKGTMKTLRSVRVWNW